MSAELNRIKWMAVVGVLFIALGVGLWYPYHRQRVELRHRIDSARKELGISPDGSDDWSSLPTQVASLREQTSGAQKYIPQEGEVASVLRSLTESLQAHAVGNQEVLTRRVKRFADYSVIPVNLEFSGSYPASFGVLKRIEAMPRLIRIDRLRLEAGPRDPEAPLTVGLDLSTFFSKAPEEGGL